MTYSVKDIRNFYQSNLGKSVKNQIEIQISECLPSDLKNQTILGIGYAVPYLDEMLSSDNTVLSFMSDTFGCHPWPNDTSSKVALIHDWLIPLQNHSVDYIILVHSVEFSTHIQSYFKEIWRILKRDGKLIVILPSRLSFWAMLENTPFGFGQPYTMGQAIHLLSNNGFVIEQQKRLLYGIPSQSTFLRSIFKVFEWIGPYLFKKFAGVNMVFATKKTFAFSISGLKEPTLSSKQQLTPSPSIPLSSHKD
ncbi:MAG: methyltransferase domain-containing protein [Proteobacteria bacterium]|nr:methyltransferase domain-containing protein [Pseudomonadota bacterium]